MISGKFLFGLLTGAAAGVAIGVLFAPEKGVDTRKKLIKKGGDLAVDLKNRLAEWYETGMQQYESVKEHNDATQSSMDDTKTS